MTRNMQKKSVFSFCKRRFANNLFLPSTLFALLTFAAIKAEIPHLELKAMDRHFIAHYELTDLGTASLNEADLSRLGLKNNLFPLVNNHGKVTVNAGGISYVTLPKTWEFCLKIGTIPIEIYGINDQSDLLVGLKRSKDSIEWMIWPWASQKYSEKRKHVHSIDLKKADLSLVGFNNQGKCLANGNGEEARPYLWEEGKGWQMLGASKGVKLTGHAKGINQCGHVAGIFHDTVDSYPFFWDEDVGLEAMRSYRKELKEKGWIEFTDLVLADDNTIFGTFWVRHGTIGNRPKLYNHYHAYKWDTQTGKIDQLPVEDMRISDVNIKHELVGSWQGQAALYDPTQGAIKLIDLMDPEKTKGWKLTEATSINDKGHIVGYGYYNESLHLFFATPVTVK